MMLRWIYLELLLIQYGVRDGNRSTVILGKCVNKLSYVIYTISTSFACHYLVYLDHSQIMFGNIGDSAWSNLENS